MSTPPLPCLLMLCGRPGVGKTTIARLLSRHLGAAHLRIDTIEQALRWQRPGVDIGADGYAVAQALAADQLALGLSVVADAVNATAAPRDAWRAIARHVGARFHPVLIVCSDADVHRTRVAARRSDLVGHRLPDWAAIQALAFELPADPLQIVDTARVTPAAAVAQIATALARRVDDAGRR